MMRSKCSSGLIQRIHRRILSMHAPTGIAFPHGQLREDRRFFMSKSGENVPGCFVSVSMIISHHRVRFGALPIAHQFDADLGATTLWRLSPRWPRQVHGMFGLDGVKRIPIPSLSSRRSFRVWLSPHRFLVSLCWTSNVLRAMEDADGGMGPSEGDEALFKK